MTGQTSTIRTGALHPDLVDLTKPQQPVEEFVVLAPPNRERFNPERSAVGVDRSSEMEVEVGVNPTSDQGPVLYDGHRHPFQQCVDGTTPAGTADLTSRTVGTEPEPWSPARPVGAVPKTRRRVIHKTTPKGSVSRFKSQTDQGN